MSFLRRFLRRSPPLGTASRWDLGKPLLWWSQYDPWTIRDAVEGTLVTGATGSGKTSGSGRALATAFLRNGFGGLVLTAKADERATWERYCEETGRSADLVIFGADATHRFNFLDHERTRAGAGAGLTENLVNLFSTVLEVAERGSGGSGRDEEGYWRRANRQLIRNAVDLLSLAGRRVTAPDLYRLVLSAPTSVEQVRSGEWRSSSLCFACLQEADKLPKSSRARADLEIVADYFLIEWPALSEKTRSVVLSTFTSTADILVRGLLRDLFCADTTVTPEIVQEGKIVLVDLPVKEFAEVGQFAQVLWKYAFQRTIERRPGEADARPVFLWADEAQYFITSADHQFQTTCRSSRVATVLLTQNVSNVYAALGSADKGKTEAASLFANLNTKVLHANADPVTNEWAASLIGRSRQYLANGSSSYAPDDTIGGMPTFGMLGKTPTTNAGFSEAFEFEVQPSAFTGLRKGGAENGWIVDAFVFQNGRVFPSSGKTWLKARFDQRHGQERRSAR